MLFKRKAVERCDVCRKFLSDTQKQMGICLDCAKEQITKIKKRIIISALAGMALNLVVFAAIHYAGVTGFPVNGDIHVPFFFGYLAYNAHAFNALINPAPIYRALLAALCFFAPFSGRVNFQYVSFRGQAEINLYKTEPLTGRMTAAYGAHRMDSAGIFIAEILVSIIAGPLFFIYRPLRIMQLSNYVKLQEAL